MLTFSCAKTCGLPLSRRSLHKLPTTGTCTHWKICFSDTLSIIVCEILNLKIVRGGFKEEESGYSSPDFSTMGKSCKVTFCLCCCRQYHQETLRLASNRHTVVLGRGDNKFQSWSGSEIYQLKVLQVGDTLRRYHIESNIYNQAKLYRCLLRFHTTQSIKHECIHR